MSGAVQPGLGVTAEYLDAGCGRCGRISDAHGVDVDSVCDANAIAVVDPWPRKAFDAHAIIRPVPVAPVPELHFTLLTDPHEADR